MTTKIPALVVTFFILLIPQKSALALEEAPEWGSEVWTLRERVISDMAIDSQQNVIYASADSLLLADPDFIRIDLHKVGPDRSAIWKKSIPFPKDDRNSSIVKGVSIDENDDIWITGLSLH